MIPQMIPCPGCKGNGETYELRGEEDKHIVKCSQCEGAGLIQYAWPKESKAPESVNLDTLLAEEDLAVKTFGCIPYHELEK